MIESINNIEDRILFFVLIVTLLLVDVFTKQAGMTELAKLLVTAYAGYMTGRVVGVEKGVMVNAVMAAKGELK